MKVETRGKYAGVKIHLDLQETQILMDLMTKLPPTMPVPKQATTGPELVVLLANHVSKTVKKFPEALKEKTPDQIKEVLAAEAKKASEALEQLQKGATWDPKKGLSK